MPARKSSPESRKLTVTAEVIERRIHLIRDHKVMLDSDLAELYGVTTGVLNQAVKRNLRRFPEDFMFQLTAEETESLISQFVISSLRSQIVTSKKRHGGRRTAPNVFTEQGVAMLSSVLNSERAIEVNITIMRAFVKLRQMLTTNEDLARKLEEMERKYDAKFRVVFEAIRELMQPPTPPRKKIGF